MPKDNVVAYFSNPDKLASAVSAAVQPHLQKGFSPLVAAAVLGVLLLVTALIVLMPEPNLVNIELTQSFNSEQAGGHILWCKVAAADTRDIDQDSAYTVSFSDRALDAGSYSVELTIQPAHTMQTRYLFHDASFEPFVQPENDCPSTATFKVDALDLAGENRLILSLRRPRGQSGQGSKLLVNVRDPQKQNAVVHSAVQEIDVDEW